MTQLNAVMTHLSGDWLRLGHAFLTLWQGQADHCIALSHLIGQEEDRKAPFGSNIIVERIF